MVWASKQAQKEYDKKRYQEKKEYFKDKQKKWVADNREWFMWRAAKLRARKLGVPFKIKHFSDLVIPDVCPILGIPLKFNTGFVKGDSPSLDRIIPDKGYVPGNIQIISQRANTMKNDASIQELQKFAGWVYANYP